METEGRPAGKVKAVHVRICKGNNVQAAQKCSISKVKNNKDKPKPVVYLNVTGLNLSVSCSFNPEPHVCKNNCCLCFFFLLPLDAILNMVNNIAANVLGGKPELEGGTETGGTKT